jgi:protein involved in polysaccharide export with SLBB domain
MNLLTRSVKVFFLLIAVFFPIYLSAQDDNTSQIEGGFNVDLSSSLGGIYYQDMLGIQLAGRRLPLEGIIDEATYVLGANDLISVELNTSQKILFRGILINPQGDVVLPSVGTVKLAGLNINEAEKTIQEASSSTFNDVSVKISIESPRTIVAHITGGVPFPGKYITLPQSRVDQVIYQSITDGNRDVTRTISNSSDFLNKGDFSFRDITIQRADGSTISADLIKYFKTGNFDSNPFIKDGDLIIINKLSRESPKVSISGGVRTDFEIEFKKGDNPQDLLDIAGGFVEDADRSKMYVFRRSVSGVERIDISPDQWDSFNLLPNDRLVVPLSREADNSTSAWVYGEVQIPGNFPIVNGKTTALELLELTGNVTPEALISAAYLVRNSNPKNAIPNDFNPELLKRTSDQLIQGLEYLEAESKVSQNKVFIDLTDRNQLANLKIYDGDRLYIPRDQQTIFVFGQVNNPGYFPYSSENNFTVADYISKAGGFALAADKERIFVIKAGISTWYDPSDTNIESGDKIFIDRQPIEELNALRTYEIQKAQLRNQRVQLVMTAITTITGIITTYVAINNIN